MDSLPDDPLSALFADLEQLADGLAHVSRDHDVAELGRVEYAEVELLSRLLGSRGEQVELDVSAYGALRGRLVAAGAGWVAVDAHEVPGRGGWVVALAHVHGIRGLAERSVPEPVRPLTARLGILSVLRRMAEQPAAELVAVRPDGRTLRGALVRVAADFVELGGVEGRVVVPVSAVAMFRTG